MIVKNPRFEISAISPRQYPHNGLPEIVLVGKSNVGKSSFINTMLNRKSIARTSNTPGKTRQINFYNIDEQFYFVDLPGYGYSEMSKSEQLKVGHFIEEYLSKSKYISCIILLLDIRHKPTENDLQLIDFLYYNQIPFSVVLTKVDKLSKAQLSKNLPLITATLKLGKENLIKSSSQTGQGREEILEIIERDLSFI